MVKGLGEWSSSSIEMFGTAQVFSNRPAALNGNNSINLAQLIILIECFKFEL